MLIMGTHGLNWGTIGSQGRIVGSQKHRDFPQHEALLPGDLAQKHECCKHRNTEHFPGPVLAPTRVYLPLCRPQSGKGE